MKKTLRLLLTSALFATSLNLFAAETPSVSATAIIEHPSLDAVRDGILAELKEAGMEPGKGLDWEYQTAQGDMGTAQQIARKYVGDQPKVIVAITTPSAQAVAAAARGQIPVLFSAVTDPVAAKLVDSLEQPGKNITGVSDMLPMGKHVELIQEVVPGARTIGVPYNPGEANSVVLLESLRKEAEARGLKVIEAAAPSTNDVLAAARSLVGKVDVIYISTDNTIISALEAVVKVGIDAKIPVLTGDTDSVKRGAIAAIGFDYFDVGRQSGKMLLRLLKGENPGDIPVETVSVTQLHVNPAAAEKMGVTLPQPVIERANFIIK